MMRSTPPPARSLADPFLCVSGSAGKHFVGAALLRNVRLCIELTADLQLVYLIPTIP